MTTRKKGEDARHEDAATRTSTGRGESGNRPGVDEKPSGVTEEEAGRAKDGKAGLQEAGLSSVGRSDPKGMSASRSDRKEKGPNGEIRYFLQRQGANVGAPMPFNVAIGQLSQDTEQRPA